jgi:hypothetical protein
VYQQRPVVKPYTPVVSCEYIYIHICIYICCIYRERGRECSIYIYIERERESWRREVQLSLLPISCVHDLKSGMFMFI